MDLEFQCWDIAEVWWLRCDQFPVYTIPELDCGNLWEDSKKAINHPYICCPHLKMTDIRPETLISPLHKPMMDSIHIMVVAMKLHLHHFEEPNPWRSQHHLTHQTQIPHSWRLPPPLGIILISQVYERSPAECVGFGKAISNVTLEPKPWS